MTVTPWSHPRSDAHTLAATGARAGADVIGELGVVVMLLIMTILPLLLRTPTLLLAPTPLLIVAFFIEIMLLALLYTLPIPLTPLRMEVVGVGVSCDCHTNASKLS